MEMDADAMIARIAAQIEAGETGEARKNLHLLRVMHPDHPQIEELEQAIETWYGAFGRAQRETWREWLPTPPTCVIAGFALAILSAGGFALRVLGDTPAGMEWTPLAFAIGSALCFIAAVFVTITAER